MIPPLNTSLSETHENRRKYAMFAMKRCFGGDVAVLGISRDDKGGEGAEKRTTENEGW